MNKSLSQIDSDMAFTQELVNNYIETPKFKKEKESAPDEGLP